VRDDSFCRGQDGRVRSRCNRRGDSFFAYLLSDRSERKWEAFVSLLAKRGKLLLELCLYYVKRPDQPVRLKGVSLRRDNIDPLNHKLTIHILILNYFLLLLIDKILDNMYIFVGG
jgi:hypothetical protein